jgi:hypothetical protein
LVRYASKLLSSALASAINARRKSRISVGR